MQLTPEQIEKIVQTARTYLDQPYSKENFTCVHFVREVYRHINIEIPVLMSYAPPREFNISKDQLNSLPSGYLMFLKDRHDPRIYRAWTHIVIILSAQECIHSSLFYGKKVIISKIEDIWKKYDFAESTIF